MNRELGYDPQIDGAVTGGSGCMQARLARSAHYLTAHSIRAEDVGFAFDVKAGQKFGVLSMDRPNVSQVGEFMAAEFRLPGEGGTISNSEIEKLTDADGRFQLYRHTGGRFFLLYPLSYQMSQIEGDGRPCWLFEPAQER